MGVKEEITWAKRCYLEKGDKLLHDKSVVDLLTRFKKAALDSQRAMVIIGVVEECRSCEESEGGSCCGAGLENQYKGILLLINLLLGIEIPGERLDPSSCLFLGRTGCRLIARHVICLNYLCKKITDHIHPESIKPLREKEGAELGILFLLNEQIKKTLQDSSDVHAE
ncbi:MAG: hypothetical protein V1930_01170 [Pseudomonadota bacterium]